MLGGGIEDAFESQKLCLDHFLVINKLTVIQNRRAMLSSAFKGQKLHEMHTSGSTGIPFVIQQDAGKRKRVIAEIKEMSDEAGYKSHEKMLYIMGATKLHPYSHRQEFCENIYRYGVSINDDETMKRLTDFLLKKKPVAIHASVSNLPPLIEYIKRNHYSPERFTVRTIITGGEMIPDKLRENLIDTFGEKCRVVAKYSNEEMGIMSQDNGIGTPYKLNVADYYFEILKIDSDEACAEGELGRIVVTDLYNFALPLIRYDTGDLGALVTDKISGWPVMTELSGKIRDIIYDTEGHSISGLVMTNVMKFLDGVKQYQFVQTGETEYVLKLIPDGDERKSNTKVVDELKKMLGRRADIKIEYVDSVVTTRSGKTRYTVQLYKQRNS